MKNEKIQEDSDTSTIYTRELRIYVQLPGQPNGDAHTEIRRQPVNMNWSNSKVALIELIYGLQSAGVFNNGTADIKQITSFFENVFHIDLGNVYNVFQEMRIRKKNRTVFLDLLRDRVIQRMDEADEI